MEPTLPNSADKENFGYIQDYPPNYPSQPGYISEQKPGDHPPPQQQPVYPAPNIPPPRFPMQAFPAHSPGGMIPHSPGGMIPPSPGGMIPQQGTSNTTVVLLNQPAVGAIIPVVNDHLSLSTFACLCCFCPLGIVAIVKSIESKNRYAAGDYADAINSAKTAKNLAVISIVLGVIISTIVPVVRIARAGR